MAQSNPNPLLKSWLIVALFWYLILYLFTENAELSAFSSSLGRGVFVAFVGICAGVLAHAIVLVWLRGNAAWVMNGDTRYGATVTLGRLPEAPRLRFRKWWDFRRGHSVFKVFPWFDAYAEHYPAHAIAFKAVYDLLQEAPGHPVTMAAEGHGKLTLLQHSIGVVATMLATAPQWKYIGHRNRKGEVTIPLADPTKPYHSFEPDDPLLPLAALAHDIGKLTCYAKQLDGTYTEVRKFHDIEGAKILRGIPGVRQIPFDDWTALVLAMEYYHHLSDIPRSSWVTDRMRSLVELLLYVDQEASRQEGRSVDASTAVVPDATNAPLPFIPALPEDETPPPTAALEAFEDPEDEESEFAASARSAPPQIAVSRAVATEDQPTALDLTTAVLRKTNSVNGNNANDRIAFKFGDHLYINGDRLRKAIATATNDKSYLTPAPKGALHPFLVELIQQLHAAGMIKHESGNAPLDAKRAIYDTSAQVPDKPSKLTSGVLIVKTVAFPWTANIPNCHVEPTIAAGGSQLKASAQTTQNYSKVSEDDTIAAQDKSRAPATGVESLGERIRRRTIAMEIPHLVRTNDEQTILVIAVETLKEFEPDFDVSELPEGMVVHTGQTGLLYVGFRIK